MSLTHHCSMLTRVIDNLLNAAYYQFSNFTLYSGSEAFDTDKHAFVKILISFCFCSTTFSWCCFKFGLDSILVFVMGSFSFANTLNICVLQVSAANLCLLIHILLSHPHMSFESLVSTAFKSRKCCFTKRINS